MFLGVLCELWRRSRLQDLFEFFNDYATAHRGQKYVEIWNAARTRKQLLKTQKNYPAASQIGS